MNLSYLESSVKFKFGMSVFLYLFILVISHLLIAFFISSSFVYSFCSVFLIKNWNLQSSFTTWSHCYSDFAKFLARYASDKLLFPFDSCPFALFEDFYQQGMWKRRSWQLEATQGIRYFGFCEVCSHLLNFWTFHNNAAFSIPYSL